MKKNMTRLEFMAVLVSLKALLEENKIDKALEILSLLINEAKKNSPDK